MKFSFVALIWTFWGNPPLADYTTVFLKAPSAPIYTYLEGKRVPKKRVFLVKTFRTVSKTPFWPVFPKDHYSDWESTENQFSCESKKNRIEVQIGVL